MNIQFDKPIHASSRVVPFKKIMFTAGGRKVYFRYVIGTLKNYSRAATIGYLDNITIGTLDPHTIQWFSDPT